MKSAPAGAQGAGEEEDPEPPNGQQEASQHKVPDPRPSPAADEQSEPGEAPGQLWDDGAALMDAAFQQLEPAQRSAFIQRYFMVSEGVDAVATDLKRSLSSPARTSLAAILRQVAEELLSDHKS